MGSFTGDMIRLCGEINALRGARVALKENLARGAKDLQQGVAGMQAGFRRAHADMARKARGERMVFLSDLKKTVLGMRKDLAADLAGARRAWLGRGA